MSGRLVELEQVPRIEQPRDSRFTAMARPMPREAPVITATFPVRSWGLGGDVIVD